jgi:type 1 glutamine amidotransferase
MTTRPRVTVLSGHGRYEDRWHDFPATSHRIADTLADADLDVTLVGTWPRTLTDLGSPDLLVVNSGLGLPDAATDDDAWAGGWETLRSYLGTGRPVIGIHTACNTFHDVPEWLDRLGGAWIEGSMHPPIGWATVAVTTPDHAITDGLGAGFDVWDERYSLLDLRADDAVVLATHDLDGAAQPLVWARETSDGRTVYDALGHGLESYDSPQRRQLLQAEARWALALP